MPYFCLLVELIVGFVELVTLFFDSYLLIKIKQNIALFVKEFSFYGVFSVVLRKCLRG